MSNRWMSLWLSAVNSWGGAVRGFGGAAPAADGNGEPDGWRQTMKYGVRTWMALIASHKSKLRR
jgi:hypothetical protein